MFNNKKASDSIFYHQYFIDTMESLSYIFNQTQMDLSIKEKIIKMN